MSKIKLTKYAGSKSNLAEIFQPVDIKFALLNEEWEQVGHPAKCRDFLGDHIWARRTAKKVSIYSFQYDYAEKPYYTEELRMSLRFPDIETRENFLANIHKVWEKEDKAGVVRTQVHTCVRNSMTLAVVADKNWLDASWKLSLYSYYLKLASYGSGPLKYPEKGYAEKLTTVIEDKFLSRVTTPTQYMDTDSLSTHHNSSGFVSIINSNSPSYAGYTVYNLVKEVLKS